MYLKNRNIIFKTKISKVTDYAALNDCHKKSTVTRKLYNKMFIAYINLLSFGAFFIIVASIVLRQLFLQEIWKYIDLNGDVTRWQIITIVSRVKINRVLYFFIIH